MVATPHAAPWAWLARPAAWPLATPILGMAAMLLPPAPRAVVLNALILLALVGVTWALFSRARAFPREATAWRWYGTGFACFVVVYGFYLLRMISDTPVPWVIDQLVLLATSCQVIGLLCLPVRRALPGTRLRTAMDAITFTLAVICLQWLGGVAELSARAPMSLADQALAVAPYSAIAMTIGMLVYLAGARPERYLGVLGLLFTAEALGTLNNLIALSLMASGSYTLGHPVDLLSTVFLAFTTAAALWPHPVEHDVERPQLLRLTAYVPYLPFAALLALLLERHATDRLGAASGVLWLVYPLVGVVLLRQYLTLLDLRRLSATLEAQVEERTRALAAAREELLGARRLEALGRLAGGVAHDFNDLLTDIGGHAHLIARALPAGDAVTGFAVDVQRAVERGAGLTRQILTFARRLPGEPRVFEPAQLLRGLERLLVRLVDERTELVVTTDAEGAHVRMDPGQLEQVVVNLVVNARDALREGGRIVAHAGIVALDARQVERHAGAPGRYVAISVTDDGEGMSPETRARAFEPFFTTKAPGKGTGLGLATSYGIVRQAGGLFTVESEPGRGSTFVVHLPITDEVPTPPAAAPATSASGAGRVLLIDASPLLRATLAEALSASGFDVVHLANGAEAAETLRHGGGAIDVLVTDVLLPGVEARTILTSGHHDLPEEALPARASILAKPFLPDDLVRKIVQVMERA